MTSNNPNKITRDSKTQSVRTLNKNYLNSLFKGCKVAGYNARSNYIFSPENIP